MNRRRAVGALCVLFAVAFAANTLWLVPGGNATRYEYRTVSVNESNANHFLRQSSSVAYCAPRTSRTCGFELAAIRGGVPVDAELSQTYPDYQYVLTRDGFYDPTAEVQNGTTVFTARSVSLAPVLANVSYRPLPEAVRADRKFEKGIRVGHLRTTSEIPPSRRLVNRSGTYYGFEQISAKAAHPFLGPKLFAIRTLLWLATVPLSVLGIVFWHD
ncbi:hypothetical protein ZOD2009_10005 [Haladaptatus paucihalophilus DX253]|uniref:Uncharacterized protein n=1 Tax=Haladaptatus paucihalophilus DX253 TaxID=797209 RepID=E7QT73_HALPU|nr:hypothetical protein [Haladaptatus paucihalophilus]EFW91802.1 hypothetical protein ZOD2009_10005 [Haladaptatus paucihalophilus DX253]SHK79530.1 hypothetical protein SAMN05444342_2204 [Haladaptatus paucihalophilus DX253]